MTPGHGVRQCLFEIRRRHSGKNLVDVDQRIMTGEKRLQNVQKRRTRAVWQPAQHTILDTRRRRRNADQQSFPGGGEFEPHTPLVAAIDNTLDEASRAERL